MARKVLFKLADATGNALTEVEGTVCLLTLGDKRHRFVIHGDSVSDYRTGYRLGSYRGKQVLRVVSNPYARRLTDRDAAQLLLNDAVARNGLDRVRAVLAKPPTLNA
jgi:hypothetical protein